MTNALRHPTHRSTGVTSSGEKAPPHRALIHRIPCARTLSPGGSQVVNTLVKLGKQPASPAPNRKRVTSMDVRFQAAPVNAVKNDHHTTTRMSTLRAPIRSPK